MKNEKIIINKVINSGLILEDPNENDYHSELFHNSEEQAFGAVSPLDKSDIIFPNGKGWIHVAKSYGNPEIQLNDVFDTYSCILFAIAKAMCYYLFKKHGIKITISEMYNAFYAEVVQGRGTTIRKGMESFRKYGWVRDRDYPFIKGMTAREFFQKPPKSIKIMAKGKLTEWEFHWEVLPKDLRSIVEQYKKTPVVLTGFAWASYYGNQGVYYDYNNMANHCFLGLELLENGNNFCDDSYPKTFKYKESPTKDELFKELHESFKYGSAHCCWLTPKGKKKTLITLLNKSMENFYYYWDGKHNMYYIGVPSGETKEYRQRLILADAKTNYEVNVNFTLLALRGGMNQSSWAEVKKYPDISLIGKKFA